MRTVSDYFGSLVFDDRVMRAKLPSDVYASLKRTIDEGASLDTHVADAVATAMRDWAVEHGAPPAVCGPPLRPVAIPPGTPPPMLSSKAIPCVSPQLSALTAGKLWIRKRRCCDPCRR